MLIEEIKLPFPEEREYKEVKSLYFRKTIAYMIASLVSGLLAFGEFIFEGFLRSMRNIKSLDDVVRWLVIMAVVALVIFGRQLYKTLKMYFKYRDISKDIHQIGEALVRSLSEINIISTPLDKLKVVSDSDRFGAVYCHLEGGTTYEKSVFIKSLQEIIGQVDNPRYVIIRKSSLLVFLTKKDYHSVPELIGKKKKTAAFFESKWREFVGRCELIYTRTIEGRKIILKSRLHSLASEFVEDSSERVNKWR